MRRAEHTHAQGFYFPWGFFWFCDAAQCFQEHKGKGGFLEASLENELAPQKCRLTQDNTTGSLEQNILEHTLQNSKRKILNFSLAV